MKTKQNFPQFLKTNFNYVYGSGSIKTFSPQIKKGLEIAAKYNLNTPIAKKKMRALGFKVKKSSGVAFVGEKQVLKLMYETTDEKSLNKYKAPTTVLRIDKNDMGQTHYKLVVQPKVTIPSLRERNKIVDHFNKLLPNSYADIHSGNCGIYNNRKVLFDW
jgi:hypothetical protein